MSVSADGRPVFDFENSLVLAKRLYDFGNGLQGNATQRATDRNTSLDAWEGVHGDDFRLRAETEDRSVQNAVAVLHDDAWEWAKAWLVMVNNINRVIFAEARDAQVLFQERQQDDGFGFGDLVRIGTNPVGELVGWATGGEDESFAAVPEPVEWSDPPMPPNFAGPAAPFARYHRSGNDLVLSYVDYVPPVYRD